MKGTVYRVLNTLLPVGCVSLRAILQFLTHFRGISADFNLFMLITNPNLSSFDVLERRRRNFINMTWCSVTFAGKWPVGMSFRAWTQEVDSLNSIMKPVNWLSTWYKNYPWLWGLVLLDISLVNLPYIHQHPYTDRLSASLLQRNAFYFLYFQNIS